MNRPGGVGVAVRLDDFALEVPREISVVPALEASPPIVPVDHASALRGIGKSFVVASLAVQSIASWSRCDCP